MLFSPEITLQVNEEHILPLFTESRPGLKLSHVYIMTGKLIKDFHKCTGTVRGGEKKRGFVTLIFLSGLGADDQKRVQLSGKSSMASATTCRPKRLAVNVLLRLQVIAFSNHLGSLGCGLDRHELCTGHVGTKPSGALL